MADSISRFKKILVAALLLRLLIAPFFYHPDIKSQYFHFQFLSYGITDIYQYLAYNKSTLPYKDTFNYLPLTYFSFGTINIILKPFMPHDFSGWINDWGVHQNEYPNLPFMLLLLKIPYIILDFAIAFFLFKKTKSLKVLIIWLFNPISLYLIYILGNFDIFPVFLTLVSYYLLKSKTKLAFLLLGVAIAVKFYPLIFLPFYLLSINKNLFRLIKYIFIALTPLMLTIFPFFFNQYFWASFFGSGLTQKIIELKLYNIPIFPLIYVLLLISAFLQSKVDIPKYIFYIFLLFISTVNFHPQWLLWFLPFLIILKDLTNPKYIVFLTVLFLLVFIYIFLFNDNYLTWGHLIPVDPEFISLTSPFELVKQHIHLNPVFIQNYSKIAISAISFILFFFYEKTTNHHLA